MSRQAANPARRLVANGSVYAIATVAPTLAIAFVTPLLTRVLGGEQYGLVAIGLSVVQIAVVMLGLGLPTSLSRHVLLEKSGAGGAVAQVLMVATTSAGTAGILALGLLFLPASASALPHVLLLGLITATALAVSNAVQAVSLAARSPTTFVTQAMIVSLFPQGVGYIMVKSEPAGAVPYFTGFAAGHACAALILVAALVVQHKPVRVDGDLSRGIRIGLPTVAHQLAGAAVPAGLVAISGLRLGFQASGETQLALLVGTAPMMFIAALNNSWAMQTYAVSEGERSTYLADSARLVAGIASGLAIGLAAISPVLLSLLTGQKFDINGIATIASIIAASACLNVLYLANMHQLVAARATGGLAISTPVAAGVALVVALTAPSFWPAEARYLIPLSVLLYGGMQAAFTTILRRRTAMKTLNLRWPLGLAALTLGVDGGVSQLPPALTVRLPLAILTAIYLAYFVRTHIARKPSVSPKPFSLASPLK